MASSAAASFLLPQAVSFLRWPSKHKTLSPPTCRWNPLFVRSTPLAVKSLFFPVPAHGKFARVLAQSSFLGAVGAAEDENQVVWLPRSVLDGGGLLCSVLEALRAPKGSGLLVAVFWGVFVTTVSPCAALLTASSSFFYVRQPTSALWSYSGFCSPHHGSTRLGPDIEESVLFLMLGSVAAVKLLAGFLSVSYDGWTAPRLQVSMTRSHSRALHQFVKNSESPFLGELSSVCTDFDVPKANFRNATEVAYLRGRNMGIKWNNRICFPRKLHFQGLSPNNRQIHVVKGVATSTPQCLVHTDCDAKLLLVSHLDVQEVNFKTINDETSEVDDRERLRRLRISKANKGNVPWNKGRKHSAETLQLIRERTKLAMQNPKVKMKLVNLGHAQSEETRIKIAAGVREGWRRRQHKRLVQEGCFFEWQNLIAESARKGWDGEEELQWDSYKTLDKQLKQQWLESMEKRKNMPRIKGSKRAPKSPEQRRKISEAISAKWADEEYRARVCSGLAKYHGAALGVERRPRKPSGESPVRKTTRKRTVNSESMSHDDSSNKKVVPKRKSSTPSYKDPMASQKLEIIKKIREQRAVKEAKVAMERAKLLIAEAEKAAKALEIAALTSPLAQASLWETRKLIAEATRSIETIETGRSTIQDFTDKRSLDTSGPLNHFPSSNAGVPTAQKFNEKLVNGFHLLSSSQTNDTNHSSDNLSSLAIVSGMEPETGTQTEKPAEFGSSLHTKIVEDGSEKVDHPMSRQFVSSSIQYEVNSAKEDTGKPEVKSSVPSKTFSVKSKKWVRGRLIEIDENDTWEEDSIVGKK